MPRIVGSKVKINALVTLLGVLVGGAICGVPFTVYKIKSRH
jgi:predicted PurR-regulated permease PerM